MRSLQDGRDLPVSFQASLPCLQHLVCVCLESRIALPGSLIKDDSAEEPCNEFEKILNCAPCRAYAPTRSHLELVISLSFRLVIQLAIYIAILAFELERLVVVVGIVQLYVHNVPNAGDRRVFANGSICIASFCPTAVRILIKI
jgi:hypothetical protein